MRSLLLDLFCGAGGAAVGYHRAGFDVIGVDLNPQPAYPFEFHQADALDVLETGEMTLPYRDGRPFCEIAAIHASPPCQRYTTLAKGNNGNIEDYPDYAGDVRRLLNLTGLPWVIENVPGAPIHDDLTLCGLQFGLKVFRHRKFETGGWTVERLKHESHRGHRVSGYRHGKWHDGDMFAVYGLGGGKGSVADWQRAMGIGWTSVRKEIAEAIPPAYTEYIGSQLLQHLTCNEENDA